MGPKKEKEIIIDENAWRTKIENAVLDEESWKAKVIMMEPAGSEQDRIYLNKFEIFSVEERRFVVKNICKTETVYMINQLGGEKKVKDDDLRVFEEGQIYLKEKKDIPPDILALIIKHLILKMKEESLYIRRQRIELIEGMRRESATMLDKVEVRGTVNVKKPEVVDPLTVPLKGKKKGEEANLTDEIPKPDEDKKYNTTLRVRGEEWRDKVYKDDYPIDGPDLYVAITGFMEPNLLRCLVNIGIPLTAVVQIRVDPNTTTVPSTLFRDIKKGQSQTELLMEQSTQFWEDIQQLRINKETGNALKNIAFIIFCPPYWDSDNLSGNPDKIYDELCYLMYDVQDLSRQHKHYLNNLDVLHIPNDLKQPHFVESYSKQLNFLPLECVTTYSVLDSILQIVSRNDDMECNSKRSSLLTSFTTKPSINVEPNEKLEKTESLVKEVFNMLCKTNANRKLYRLTYGEEYENHKDPIIINFGDFVKYKTFHLRNINLENIVRSSLLFMPINNLWVNQNKPESEKESKINFHVNVLLNCFERQDIETTELNRLINILTCRKLFNNRSSLKKQQPPLSTILDIKKYLKRSVLAEPIQKCPSSQQSSSNVVPSPSKTKSESMSIVETSLIDESTQSSVESNRIQYLFECPDISELVSAAEIENQKAMSHLIDDFEFFEDFNGLSSFQVLSDAFNNFNCVNYKYCEVTDKFVLMFFNSHNKDGIARENWHCHLTTPVCLQDFFDFIIEENYEWIQTEEKLYSENLLRSHQSSCKELCDPLKSNCIENTDVEFDLLIEGSLKYQQKENFIVGDAVDSQTLNQPNLSTLVDTKYGKKAKSPQMQNVKSSEFIPSSKTSIVTPKKPFFGYDLGDRRVEVIGKDSVYFSKDGTRVTSKYIFMIPMNVEYIMINVVPGNGHNTFWVQKALGDEVPPETLDSCESFRITSKDEIMFNIRKQTFQIPLPTPVPSIENTKPRVILKSTSERLSTHTVKHIMETRTFHSFVVTWPNGLITESVHENSSQDIIHIKQYHVNSKTGSNEDMRCVSLNGEVVIFKKSGTVDVLNPDGSLIKIEKCSKQIVIPDVPEDIPSIISYDKNKKGVKGKDQTKQKSIKSTSKTSNSDLMDPEEKSLEYEIVIEEFETTDTSGLRQNWINNKPVFIENVMIKTAIDYGLGEVFSKRMDGTQILLNKDGIQIVTFPDKTRIITQYIIEKEEVYPEYLDDEKIKHFNTNESENTDSIKSKASFSQKSHISTISSTSRKVEEEEETKTKKRTDGYVSVHLIYTIEHSDFTTVTLNKGNGKIAIDSPNNTCLEVDSNNKYYITLDGVTSANFDGEHLKIKYEACPECESYTNCDIKIKSNKSQSDIKDAQDWIKLKDSFCKNIVVNEEGIIKYLEEPCEDETANVTEESSTVEENTEKTEPSITKSESSVISHGKCRTMYLAKTVRFFVLNRDLNCSELIHRALLEIYEKDCQWQPWYSRNQCDSFGDHRSLVTILSPVYLTESEKWFMESKLADKPKYLTFKDLKKDTSKGFYHWMRPYKHFEHKPRKPENTLLPSLPRAYILRILEQQWKSSEREQLKGARELLNAILQYRRILETDTQSLLDVPVIDLRPEEERRTDELVQKLAHKVYEDLKFRLTEDIHTRTKASITTKPAPPAEEMLLVCEEELLTDEESPSIDLKCYDEEREKLLKQAAAAEKTSENLERYWRKRAEETKQEEFYKLLLRDDTVPPYFSNMLGGAIWWEMNDAAGEAVNKSERNKITCVCEDCGDSKLDHMAFL